jgi:amino-acid N-acetyltransferase
VRLRRAAERDVAPLLELINGYARRNLLLHRTEESLRARLGDFLVAEEEGEVVGCGALSELGPRLGEVRSLAVREDQAGRGIGRRIVEALLAEAGDRGFVEVLALTRRVAFFEALGFTVTRRERFLDKLQTDCQHCPLNLCCDEIAVSRRVATSPRSAARASEGAPRAAAPLRARHARRGGHELAWPSRAGRPAVAVAEKEGSE